MTEPAVTVCACVLTRDRSALLVEAIGGVLGQTRPVDRIVVVDNASEEDVAGVLREHGLLGEPRLDVRRLERNLGSAGGYAELVRLGLETGSDWLWLMDDDAEPAPDALELLLAAPEAADPRTAVLCGAVRHPDGELDLLHRGHVGRVMRALPAEAYAAGEHPELGFASFVGFMIRAEVAREIGLPKAELFISCDDVEYSLRARRLGGIRLVPESAIVHKLGMGGGSVTRRSRLWNRVLGFGYTSASWDGYWKNLYGIRNFFWIRQRYGGLSPIGFAALAASYVGKSLLYDPRPLRRIPWILRFAWKGRRGDFTAPSPAEWRAIAERRPA